MASGDAPKPGEDLQTSLGLSNVDLLAMVLSDSGLASAEPQWWNASPMGCFLIGLQPRGGWQILQRCMQWGDDGWARCFGVGCQGPALCAYFACSIRNRLEVLASDHFWSPTEGVAPGSPWRAAPPHFTVKRPTKLVDGSRGGQAFMAALLAPELGKHYSITDQARMQLLSVLLVGASLTHDDMRDAYVDVVLPRDFDLSPALGVVFTRLLAGLVVASVLCVALLVSTWWSLLRHNLYTDRKALAWMTKVLSLGCWAVGAIGLLMLGGNPRVVLKRGKVDAFVLERIARLGEPSLTTEMRPKTIEDGEVKETTVQLRDPAEEREQATVGAQEKSPLQTKVNTVVVEQCAGDEAMRGNAQEAPSDALGSRPAQPPQQTAPALGTSIKVQFGSLHGSIFTPDRGSCVLSRALVEEVCSLDISIVRSRAWLTGVAWFGLLLLAGVTLQIGGILAPLFAADLASLTFLLLTSLARGAGVSGPESWMIPRWKRRPNAVNGAVLLGQFNSRASVSV